MLNERKLDYGRALRYQLDDPDWGMTLLWVTLALLVPLIGPVVALGYKGNVIEALAREGVDAPPPRFDFDRLADYLLRGLRMFIVSLLVTFVIAPVAVVVVFAGNVMAIALFSREQAATNMLGFFVLAGVALLFVAVMVLALALVTPLTVRAALDPDFGAIFDIAFLRDFLARTWRETLIAHLMYVLIALALAVAGLIACIIGMFPAIAFALLVQAHLYGQLYLLYLRRGGRRVELAERPL